MCGIFGFRVQINSYHISDINDLLIKLGKNSEIRGSDSFGLFAFFHESKTSLTFKYNAAYSQAIKTIKYKNFIDDINMQLRKNDGCLTILGHTRLSTNGGSFLMDNVQPITVEQFNLVHNGIITNESEFCIFNDNVIHGLALSDTYAITKYLALEVDSNIDEVAIIEKTLRKIQGTAAIAILNSDNENFYLYSNNGSLYYKECDELIVFASQHDILRSSIKFLEKRSENYDGLDNIIQLSKFISFGSPGKELNKTDKQDSEIGIFTRIIRETSTKSSKNYFDDDFPDYKNLQRCSRCILPNTFPGISFDSNNICSECSSYKSPNLKDINKFSDSVKLANRSDNKILVGISGGRDSCYGLHVLKKELGYNPVAFTYDWGMVTDVARQNTANICGKLGVEHIIVSPNIDIKLRNIRLNINAWLKKPELQMIPLFMAGDKYFYYYAHELRKSLDIPAFVFCAGNHLETTNFKSKFSFKVNSPHDGVLTNISNLEKYKLVASYAKHVFTNHSYLNRSLGDTLGAFYSSYILKDDYSYLYHYYPWSESVVEETLISEYNWKGSSENISGWRVGDGTAAFYNYIYYVVAGFTEHDTFRSNQVRDGLISRNEALKRVEFENQPRWEMLEWYSKRVGFNLQQALAIIHRIPKLYST